MVVFVALLVVGLVLRALGVPYAGTYDMDNLVSWGQDVDRLGLAKGYVPLPGSYFPAAYQVFGLSIGLARAIGVSPIVGLKAVNLALDTGTLLLLIAVLRQWKLPVAYSLIYWLNPYFIVTNWLGYVDFHPAFFVLLSLWLLGRARSALATIVAALPLGIATAMKPQAITLVAMLGAFVVVQLVRGRRSEPDTTRAWLLLLGPVAVFAAYSAFFIAHGKSLLFLVRGYLDVGRFMPALTAQMPNIWYPVADFYRDKGALIESVVEPKAFHTVAAVLTAALLVFVTARIARDPDRRPFPVRVLLLFTAGAAILPMLMTRAHENHFFLAATLGVVLVALLGDRPLTILVNALLAMQAVHLFGLYGLGENRVTTALGLEKWLDVDVQGIRYGVKAYALDQPHLQTVVACITTVLFAAAAYRLVTVVRTTSPSTGRGPGR